MLFALLNYTVYAVESIQCGNWCELFSVEQWNFLKISITVYKGFLTTDNWSGIHNIYINISISKFITYTITYQVNCHTTYFNSLKYVYFCYFWFQVDCTPYNFLSIIHDCLIVINLGVVIREGVLYMNINLGRNDMVVLFGDTWGRDWEYVLVASCAKHDIPLVMWELMVAHSVH